jgi:exodeoxyribonuclease VII small subunit
MKPKTVMVVAGEPSGDALAADLVRTLASSLDSARFIGAGGPKMAAAGVECSFDLTADAVIGLVFKKLPLFRRRMLELTRLAIEEKPELVVLVDFSGFNLRLARAIRRARGRAPKIVQFVSPQVWASRPGRADKMARDYDLLLCLFPFEKEFEEALKRLETIVESMEAQDLPLETLLLARYRRARAVAALPGQIKRGGIENSTVGKNPKGELSLKPAPINRRKFMSRYLIWLTIRRTLKN